MTVRYGCLFLAVGCVVTETEEDVRPLCFGEIRDGLEIQFVEDAPLTAAFTSSNCGVVTEAWCELTRNGDILNGRTYHETERPWHTETCLAIDKSLDIRCDSEPLEAGVYTVRYAGLEHEIAVPSVVEPFCMAPMAPE